MSELLTVSDLEIAKKHDTFHSEVITGKAGGVETGANIDTATNAVTGQTQTTLPKILLDIGMKVQSWPASIGGTLTDLAQVFLNDIEGSAGKGNYYAWSGEFPKFVAAGLDPATTAGFIMRSDSLLRKDINIIIKRFNSVSGMVADTSLSIGQIVETLSYYAGLGKGGNKYTIVSAGTGTADAGSYITLNNGLQAKAIDFNSPTQFGVVGDGVADDWPSFKNACIAASSNNKKLIIDNLKIYLISQNASISSESLYLSGNGVVTPQINWTYMAGTSTEITNIINSVKNQCGSAIISGYNGAIFSGKNLNGNDYAIIGNPSKTSNCAFDTGTPTSYPGWSQPFNSAKNITAFYTGTDGFKCQGGLEVCAPKISAMYCGGYCLHVYQTTGIDSPIEYLDIDGREFSYGLLGNIYLNGARKKINISNNGLNDPGQLARLAAGGLVISLESKIVYPIRIDKDPNVTSMLNIEITDNYSEESQGIVALFGLMNDCKVEGNYLIPYNIAWPYYHAKFDAQLYNLRTLRNTSPSGTRFYFTPAQHSWSDAISMAEKYDTFKGFVQDGYALTESQMRPSSAPSKTSGTLGDGTAATFTYNLATNFNFTSSALNVASNFAVFFISSNFQGNGNDSVGGYLVYVTRMSSGNFSAIVQSTGVTTGFSAPPSVSVVGLLSIPLSQYYRARVTRIDLSALS